MKDSAGGEKGRKAEMTSEQACISPSTAFPIPSSSALPLSSQSPSRVTIAGIGVDNLSEDKVLSEIERLITQNGAHYMAVVNASKMVMASRDEMLRQILAKADIVTADGMSVVWASRLLGRAICERVTGIDMFEKLVARAAETALSVYFLGAQEHSLRKLVETFRLRHADLKVAGYRNGYFAAEEEQEIAEDIKRSRADILFVAMGSPAQERWINSHLEATGVKFALGVGGSFDHIAGLVPRAPRWMQQVGLEWLHRLMREPRRLWRRYLIGNASFVWLVTKQLLVSKSENQKSEIRP